MDFDLLYGILIKENNARQIFQALYKKAYRQRIKEKSNPRLLQMVLDIGLFCNYANMENPGLRKLMLDTGIKPGLQVYFQKIMWEHWKRINYVEGQKITFITSEIMKNLVNLDRYMWVLMGGIRNPDPRVRKEIYQELMFPAVPGKIDKILRAKNGKNTLNQLRQLLKKRVETDEIAFPYYNRVKNIYATTLAEAIQSKKTQTLASMDPAVFMRTNETGHGSYLGQILKKGFGNKKAMQVFDICLRAVENSEGNTQTQRLILNELIQHGRAFHQYKPAVKRIKQKVQSEKRDSFKEPLNKLLKIVE